MFAFMHIAVVVFLFQYAACQQEFFDPFADPEEIVTESSVDPLDQLPEDELQPDVMDNLITNLESLASNVDKAASDFANPIVQLEKELLAQIHKRNKDSREELFDKLRNNYRNLRKRIGTAEKDLKNSETRIPPVPKFQDMQLPEVPKLGEVKLPEDIAMSSSFFGMNLQNKEGRSSLDLSIPFLPMKLSISSKPKKHDKPRKPLNSAVHEVTKRISDVPSKNEDVEVSAPQGSIEESVTLQHPHNKVQFQKGMEFNQIESLLRDEDAQESDDSAPQNKEFSRRQGDAFSEDNSESRGRILGEMLYSEQMFDQMTRQVLKNHGKWALDSSVVPPQVKNQVNRVVNKVMARGDRDRRPSIPLPSAERLDSTMHGRPQQNIFGQDRHTSTQDRFPVSGHDYHSAQKGQGRGHVILAFTPEGVPLKLRMGIDIRNPLRFLQEVLSASAVSLYVPVESSVNPRPAGNEIMQLGYASGVMRAVTVDLSNPHQLDSLIGQLRRYSNGFN